MAAVAQGSATSRPQQLPGEGGGLPGFEGVAGSGLDLHPVFWSQPLLSRLDSTDSGARSGSTSSQEGRTYPAERRGTHGFRES